MYFEQPVTKDECDAITVEAIEAMRDVPHQTMLSISGGKDSTAMYLRALELDVDFRAVFADVENEHEAVYEYVDKLSERTGGPKIEIVKTDLSHKFPKRRERLAIKWAQQGVSQEIIDRALEVMHPTGNVFLDMVLLKGGFPSSNRRYCTTELKVIPIERQIDDPIRASGRQVWSWQGVRSDESANRRFKPVFESSVFERKRPRTVLRPILGWQVSDVWAMHKKHGIEPNPLYKMGFSRVGCTPCIMAKKSELRQIARLFPEHIDRLEEWERIAGLASKREIPVATFFPGNARSSKVDTKDITQEKHGIRDAVQWSKTTHGGKIYDLFALGGTACNEEGYCE